MKNKKLDLDFAEWLWAVNRNKEKEYYESRYGSGTEFQRWIGGRIVKNFFYDSPELLNIAFRYLNYDWTLATSNVFGEKPGRLFDTKYEMDFDDFTWLMFKNLAFKLEAKMIDSWVNGNWRQLWKELDKEFFDSEENKNV